MKPCIFTLILLLILPERVGAQSPFSICQSLSTSGLIDKDDVQYTETLARNQFRQICTNKERRLQNFNSSSSGLQLGFKMFSFGASGGDAGGMSQAEVDAACERGEDEYARSQDLSVRQLRGGFLATQVNECLRIATQSKTEFLAGTTEPVADDDNRFLADFMYTPGPHNIAFKLSTIEGSADVQCFSGADQKTSAIGLPLTSELSVTCIRPEGRSSTGRFIFRAGDQSTLRVPFSVPSKTVRQKTYEAMRSDFFGEVSLMVNASIPKGAVLPWYAKSGPIPKGFAICDGSNGTPDLRGQFIMGAVRQSDVGRVDGANSQQVTVIIPKIMLATGGTDHPFALMAAKAEGVVNHQTVCAGCNLVDSFTVPASTSVSIPTIPMHMEILYIMKM